MDLRPVRRPQVPYRAHHQPVRPARHGPPYDLWHLLLHEREQVKSRGQTRSSARGLDRGGARGPWEQPPQLSVLDLGGCGPKMAVAVTGLELWDNGWLVSGWTVFVCASTAW